MEGCGGRGTGWNMWGKKKKTSAFNSSNGNALTPATKKPKNATQQLSNAVLIRFQLSHIRVWHVERRKPFDTERRSENGFDVGPTRLPPQSSAFLLQRLDSRLVFANGAQLQRGTKRGKSTIGSPTSDHPITMRTAQYSHLLSQCEVNVKSLLPEIGT